NEMATEVCTLILVDGGTVASETASEILHLYNRRRRGLVDVARVASDRVDLLVEREGSRYTSTEDLAGKLRSTDPTDSGIFLKAGLAWAAKRIHSAQQCHRWDVVLASPELASGDPTPNLFGRFCPTRTRFIMLDGHRGDSDLNRMLGSGNVLRRTARELDLLYDRIEQHLVFVDISKSVGPASPRERFRDTFDQTVLPSFQASVPNVPSLHRMTLYAFGDSVQVVDKLDLDEEVASTHFPPRIFKGMGDTKTYLAGVFDAVEAAEPRWLSVWLYTDGKDDPPFGHSTLQSWLERRRNPESGGTSELRGEARQCEDNSVRRGWLYLQTPAGDRTGGVDGAEGPALIEEAARCLGLEPVRVPRLSTASMNRCRPTGVPPVRR
ncbi:MAG: hypothetical protein AAGD06_08740, partial [Acidobacteriota bacterium]